MTRWCMLATAIAAFPVSAADFPQFRGPAGNGVIETSDLPVSWEAGKNIAWTAKLPGTGWSQPIVVGKTLFVTAAVSDKLTKPKDMQEGARDMRSMPLLGAMAKPPEATVQWQLLGLDADTGAIRWTKTVFEGKPKFPIHPSNTYATETPCADAERLYAYFGATGTLAAFDHSGKELWKADVGAYPTSNGFGSGSSPALFDGKVFVASLNEKKSFLAGFDAKTGQELWKQDLKVGSSWASPFVWRNSKRTEIIACGDKVVTSHDPATGKELWKLASFDSSFAPSPAAEGDMLFLGTSSPFSSSPYCAVRAGAEGDITLKDKEKSNASVAWFRTKGDIGMASPVAAGGFLFYAGEGFLSCYDAKDGTRKYKERLPKSRMVAASPVAVGDKLLILDEAGKATWVKAGAEFEVLGTGDLKDTFWASPAVSGDRIYLRGVEGLYCIRK